LVQYLFHRDLSAEHVEVDTRHDHLLGFLHPLSVQREEAPVFCFKRLCL
jgi:hypothetical protein